MHSKNNVIRNLRAKNKKLVDKLEAAKNWINRKPPCIRDALELKELEKILEAEE